MHVHASVLDALTIFAMVALVGFAWRMAAGALAEHPIGQAMAVIY